MKAKFFAAIMIAAYTVIASCNCSLNKNDKDTIVMPYGKYELANITDTFTLRKWMPGDTAKTFFNAVIDSTPINLDFKEDSILLLSHAAEIDTLKYYSDSANKIVYAKTGDDFIAYKIIQQTDSSLNFFATQDKDSLYVLLKRN